MTLRAQHQEESRCRQEALGNSNGGDLWLRAGSASIHGGNVRVRSGGVSDSAAASIVEIMTSKSAVTSDIHFSFR